MPIIGHARHFVKMKSEENTNEGSRPPKSRVNKANRKTPAARHNIKVLRALESILLNDPEADIAAALSSEYSRKLQLLKCFASLPSTQSPIPLPVNDIRHRLDENIPAQVVCPLSSELEVLFSGYDSLEKAVVQVLNAGEVLYESAWAAAVMVFQISETIVVKAGHKSYSMTEHQTLSYLEKHAPDFPAPRPHGLIHMGVYSFLFTSYIPDISLEKAWCDLDLDQKRDISHQVDLLLIRLRSIPYLKNAPLGDVATGVCRDLRRSQRISAEPITTVESFENFIFAGSSSATPLYTGILRGLMPESTNVVLTHGDLRPANIMVKIGDDMTWKVTAIIDWESSGFYPEYWETVKAMNLLTARDKFDWYKYIPQSISP